MAVQTSTGIIASVFAGEPATYDEAGFAALAWVKVAEVTSIGEYGATTDVVEHQPLETGVTEKFKGFINYGSPTFDLARDASDAGQAILSAASDGATRFDEHSFKFEYNDGSIDYFTSKVFSYTKNPGGANNMVGSTCQLEANAKPVEVAAP